MYAERANLEQPNMGLRNAAYDTYQFSDYSKYHTGIFDEVHKRKVREEQFPKDMEAAYEIGRRLTSLNNKF